MNRSTAFVRLVAGSLAAAALSPVPLEAQVFTLAASGIITKPASFNDLANRTLRFHPVAGQAGAYRVESLPLEWNEATGAVLSNPTTSAFAASWQQNIGFVFPYAGRSYSQLYVNLNGNLSFDTPETAQMPANRDPWPDGTVRGMAATLDTRSLARQETIIAPLWQIYQPATSQVSILRDASARLVITWNVERRYDANSGYDPRGRNVFQAVLYASGQIDFSFSSLAEPDGITGLFQGSGANVAGTRIDNVARPNANAPDPVVTVRNLELSDVGSALRWRFTMAAPPPATVTSGELWYRIFLTINGQSCEASLGFNPNVRTVMNCGTGGNAMGWQINGSTVDLLVSKLSLPGVTSFAWGSDVVWFGFTGRFDQINLQQRRPVTLTAEQAKAEIDWSTLAPGSEPAQQTRSGNLFEAFHYPVVSKVLTSAPRAAYRAQFAPDDDFFVPMLDFRPDDLFNHGPSTGQIGAGLRVENIGVSSNNQDFGSPRLQVAISPLDFNGSRLREWVTASRRDYFNYAQAVGWIAHEITHRWTAFLNFRDPSGQNQPLASGSHWLPELHVPAVEPIWSDYSFTQYPERSIMDGGLYREMADGRFQLQELTYIIPAGFSGLDLYAIGLIAPEEMPDTFLIRNRQAAGPNLFTGEKVVVRGADVVAAMGPRRPSVANSQKEFKLGVYLFYDPSTSSEANPDTLRNARQVALQVANFFSRASTGRMKVTLSAPMDVPLPRINDVQPADSREIIKVSGEALAVVQTAPPGEDFVAQWNGTSVTVDGQPALVRQVSPEQLEVKLPVNLPLDSDLAVVVTTRRGSSEPFTIRLASN